jgi:4-hydroxy-tetrahydrodipicolinate synthase
MKTFEGIFVVNVTPMNDDQSLNEDALRNNIDWYIGEGVDGICCCGSTGEVVSLTPGERHRVVEIVVDQAGGRVPVLAGTTHETTSETIAYTRQAKEAGADGALILTPYYCHPDADEVYNHFKAVSDTVDLPIMLYNNPGTTGVDLPADLVARIGELENVRYVKESSGDIRRIRDILRMGKDNLKVFCGTEDLAWESFVSGAVGWICVIANIVPQWSQDLFQLTRSNETESAKAVFNRMLPMLTFLEGSGKYVQVIKAAMNKIGVCTAGPSRLPRLSFTEDEDRCLDPILVEMGLVD